MTIRFLLLYPAIVIGLLVWSYGCHRVWEKAARSFRYHRVRRDLRTELGRPR